MKEPSTSGHRFDLSSGQFLTRISQPWLSVTETGESSRACLKDRSLQQRSISLRCSPSGGSQEDCDRDVQLFGTKPTASSLPECRTVHRQPRMGVRLSFEAPAGPFRSGIFHLLCRVPCRLYAKVHWPVSLLGSTIQTLTAMAMCVDRAERKLSPIPVPAVRHLSSVAALRPVMDDPLVTLKIATYIQTGSCTNGTRAYIENMALRV